MKNIIDFLEERGFIQDKTSENLKEITSKPIKIYCGFDPSGDSLHVGHLVPIMGLAHFQRFGHTPVCLVGGATGLIGDPSGKSAERNLLSEETVYKNAEKLQAQLKRILSIDPKSPPLFFNNADWFNEFSFVHVLREIGPYFRVSTMLAKESVKQRLNSEDGMSFTEFCYQILQGYDFLHLFEKENVIAQMGGQDQWGNITAGVELTRKMKGKEVFGVTFPLLTRSDGKKFGKTEEGAVWLSADKLSPYDFYQYFVRLPDADVIKLMLLLTFMETDEIRKIEKEMKEPGYVVNSAQKRLAAEVTRIIHGEEGLNIALKTTEIARPGAETALNVASLEALSKDIPFHKLSKSEFVSQKLTDLLVKLEVLPSKGEVRRLIRSGGLYLNNERVMDEELVLAPTHLIEDKLLLVALGKKTKILISVA